MGIDCKNMTQKRSGDPNPQYFSKSTAVQMGGVLPYKWGAYCRTNGRRIAGFPFLRSLEARKALPYKWGAYCRTNWRCTAVLSPGPVGVGVSETLQEHDVHVLVLQTLWVLLCPTLRVATLPPWQRAIFGPRAKPRKTIRKLGFGHPEEKGKHSRKSAATQASANLLLSFPIFWCGLSSLPSAQ